MEWVGLIFLIGLALLIFAPDVLLFPIGWAFAGMMEPSKSRRFVSIGIALALLGPTLIAALLLLAWLLRWLELRWLAGSCVIAAAVTLLAWVISGITLGFIKSRQKMIDEQPVATDPQAGRE